MTEVLVKHPRFSIYGEIHNAIDNRVYETIFSQFEKDEIVLCEHSTFKPFLSLEEHAIRHCGFDHLLEKMKGAEWIYLKQKSQSLPVTCVDIRVEYGFPTAVEEIEFAKSGLMKPDTCFDFIQNVLFVAASHIEKCKKYPQIQRALTIMSKDVIDRYSEIKKMFAEEVSVEEIFVKFEYLTTLLRRIAGLFVDVNIAEILEERLNDANSPHISIFVGARHADTLYHVLSTLYENVEMF